MNNFKVEYLEDIKFVDWDNYEKFEMKDDCIKYIKDLQQRIDKAIDYMCINYIYCLDDNGKRDFEDYDIQEIYEILKGDTNE